MSDLERPDDLADGLVGPSARRRSAPRRGTAILVYDSRLPPRLGGVWRGVELRLLYVAGGLEFDLTFGGSSLSGTARTLGSPAMPDMASTRVVVDGLSGRLETGVDERGQFTLDGLAHGQHRLELHLGCELASHVACDLVQISELWLTTPPAGSLAEARDCVAILEAAIRDAEARAAADGSSVDAMLAREREQVSGRVPTPEQQVTYLGQALDYWRGRTAALEAQERP